MREIPRKENSSERRSGKRILHPRKQGRISVTKMKVSSMKLQTQRNKLAITGSNFLIKKARVNERSPKKDGVAIFAKNSPISSN